ncbi:MAG: Asp-tRNA(Asn)/Glu-tRNA(Gln) amidotransferase GatCAB subunit A [Candidatus Nealsonbacteria bacterium CG_4_10_14_0_2_um_filter_40_15]|uniref:Glutamyl-tRNA(Gln) amidotransferase subunit A n=1 Tax=Candidatus Nealsonbacteria bacterium CG_4_10_14_0_2_um_filter_40_15 TaxID=1974682 RepID=A0A2M7UU42_9BACT|nr:MAG: Asp-tRNA(Asn)/Glu-tRNA(Gln) amidotransferase GatCAB subunit A [Candidatus Nealsonbacteria bacterium CG_4_10_14_0_2_um_filter_40_15]
MDLTLLTIKEVHGGLKKKEFSALELCKLYLEKIKEKNKEIFAFLTVNEDSAILQAKKIDDLISRGEEISILAGIPCAIKDNILVDGVKCTAGSKILEDYTAPYDAGVVKKLKNQEAIILGKTNLDEFAMGGSTENSAFGPTRNPHDLNRVPGGSSGGSAAAVAANMAAYSLGSDTGGSIRQPASFCGVVGLKPTYGTVSRSGLIAFASSLDQIGPITKTAEDCQIVFDAIKGKDEMDSTSVEMPKIESRLRRDKIENLRIGVPKEYFVKGIDPEVEKIIKGAIKKYGEMGIEIEEVSLPHTEYALAAYYIIAPSEASANLARYDGIRYGYSAKDGKDLLEVYLNSREKGFGAEVRRRIIIGTYALSSGYYEAYYLRAQKVRTKIRNDFEKAFEKVDVILAPVSPVLPFKIGERIEDPLSMYLVDAYTVSVNLAGLPALSLPVGKVGKLPVGLQIIGRPFEEERILELAKYFENQWKI